MWLYRWLGRPSPGVRRAPKVGLNLWPLAWKTRSVQTCDKGFYPDQAAARIALSGIQEKAAKKGKPARLPVRVYPCDVCDGWHLTSKSVQGRTPPWDLDLDWTRPNGTTHLQQRSSEVIEGSRRQRKRSRAGSGS